MATGSLDDLKSRKFWVALLAEVLGTGLLVLFGCGSCFRGATVMQIALSFGLSVGTCVWMIAHVSGGHINPAVTIGFLTARRISVVRAVLYIGAQCLGATGGAALLKVITPAGVNPTFGTSQPPNSGDFIVTGLAMMIVELMITFGLVLTVFATCDGRRTGIGGSGPLAIGLSVTMGHLWAVPFTGAGTNPARVFGPALISCTWKYHWIYWVGPLVGGVCAALLYEHVFAVNATATKLRDFFSRRDYDEAEYGESGLDRPTTSKDTDLTTAH